MHSYPDGFRWLPRHFDQAGQNQLISAVRQVIAAAPLYRPAMPRTGKPLSVLMTNCGTLGWLTDRTGGYRYQARHPETGAVWPPIPDQLIRLWDNLAEYPDPPEACLINWYAPGAKLGSHTDSDEQTFDAPVLSASLGDAATFHIGGPQRGDPKQRMRLESGDVIVMGDASRRCYHGIDRIFAGTSDLLPEGGRINLTLRRVTKAV